MPEMNGDEAAAKIRIITNKREHIPIIALTSEVPGTSNLAGTKEVNAPTFYKNRSMCHLFYELVTDEVAHFNGPEGYEVRDWMKLQNSHASSRLRLFSSLQLYESNRIDLRIRPY